MTPRSLDEARRLMPHIGFALYAYEPGGPVTLELLNHGEIALTATGATEAAVWGFLFPEPLPEGAPEPVGTFFDAPVAEPELDAAVDFFD